MIVVVVVVVNVNVNVVVVVSVVVVEYNTFYIIIMVGAGVPRTPWFLLCFTILS